MICDCQHSYAVFEVLLQLMIQRLLSVTLHQFVPFRQKSLQQIPLHDYNRILRVMKRQVMPPQLREHRTYVQVCVGFLSVVWR